MLSKIKVFYIRASSSLIRCLLSLKRGFKAETSCIFHGYPRIRLKRGSQLKLAAHSTLNSQSRFNQLITAAVRIDTLTPEACIEIGEHAGISGSRIICSSKLTIGEYSIIGAGCLLLDTICHDYDAEIGWKGRRSWNGKPITIGKRCFIATECLILRGVTIGDNCVISARCVVNRDVPAGHKAYGNPMIIEPLPEALGGPPLSQDH